MEFKEPKLNQVLVRKLENRIYLLERENFKTKKYRDNEIIDKIRRMIVQEVENDY